MSASLGTIGPHVSSSHCDGSEPAARITIACTPAPWSASASPDGVRPSVVRHPDQGRHFDVGEIAADVVAVPSQHVHLVRDRLDVADDVAGVGVGRHEPQGLALAAASDEHPRPR